MRQITGLSPLGFCGAGILFGVSILWYWGTKRKVDALESQKVLLADLFALKSPDDECALHLNPTAWLRFSTCSVKTVANPQGGVHP